MKAIAIALVLAGATVALADDEPTGAAVTVTSAHDPRATLVAAFADQRTAVDKAAAQVDAKLADAVATRTARIQTAYKVLRADDLGLKPEARSLKPDEAGGLVIARRRAAVRYLLTHDRAEQDLLVDEATRLLAARQRIDQDADRATSIALPSGLIWPIRGTIARHFGAFVHDRSKATLTRRGIDLDVTTTDVVAPATGTVRYAGPIRGLDTGVILDHGEFLTVVAKLAAPVVRAGDHVDQGTVLGHPAHHRVYLEVRVEVGPGGTPIDPESVLPAR